jgi:hypothetical protein
MVIFASEDVGLADRQALPLAVAAFEALDRVGLPEARYALVHAAIALAVAPKSNSVARALSAGSELVARTATLDVPPHCGTATTVAPRPRPRRGLRVSSRCTRGDSPPHSGTCRRRSTATVYDPSRHGHEAAVAERVAALRAEARDAQRRHGAQDADRRIADMTVRDWAVVAAALFWGVLVVALCVLVARVMRVLDESVRTIRTVTDETVPILRGVNETVAGVNVELARVDTISPGCSRSPRPPTSWWAWCTRPCPIR